MKLKYNFIIQDVGGKPVAVATDKTEVSFNGMVKLNNSGRHIFELLQSGCSAEKIVLSLTEKYGISKSEAQKDVTEFIEYLTACGLIEYDN